MKIVLKDRLGADVEFVYSGSTDDGVVFDTRGGNSLLDRKRLTLRLNSSGATNRVKTKLSVPSVCTTEPGCVPTVSYTLVASADISVVKFSSADDRADLVALLASLQGSAEIANLINEGILPA